MVLVVEIEDRTSPKPFLGGWRDVARDLEYHDATSQTPLLRSRRRGCKHRQRVSVASQTSARRSRSIAVGGTDRALQTDGLCIPQLGEILLKAREPEEMRQRELAAAKIQRFYRDRRDNRNLDHGNDTTGKESHSTEKFDPLECEIDDYRDYKDFYENQSAISTESPDYRCSVPDSIGEFHLLQPAGTEPTDYALLRNLLDRWSVVEEERIHREADNLAERVAAQSHRLDREIEILRAIENSRAALARRRNERARGQFLDDLARPIDLRVTHLTKKSSNATVHIETLKVQRARQFRDLYESLLNDDEDNVNEEARINLLFALKKIARQHTCSTSSNLECLIDQELFLLSERVAPERLKNLRCRIRLSFLKLARGELRYDNRDKCPIRTQLCPSCGKLKPMDAFEVDHRDRLSRMCVDCAVLRRHRRDPEASSEIYESMLKELRRSEAVRPDGASSLAFVMGPRAIRYLIKDIWHARSAISECDELEQLRLVRLNPRTPWSPWNTLLVTRLEARMHEALDAEAAYDAELLRKFRRMNLQARLYFEAMAKTADTGISL